MNRFHKPTDEKRMVAILPSERYQDWLDANSDIMVFMVPFDSEQLRAVTPAPTDTTAI
jgi:putative SOS response-associated peptidase YedK